VLSYQQVLAPHLVLLEEREHIEFRIHMRMQKQFGILMDNIK
jgi:hypothetical protein